MWLQLSSLQSSLCFFFSFLLVTRIGKPYILWFIDKLKIISVDWIVYRRLNLFHKCEIRISTFIQLILCHFTQSVKSVIYYTVLSPDDFFVANIFYSLQRDSFWTLASKIVFCYRSMKNKESWLSFTLYHLFLNHSMCVCMCVCVCVCMCVSCSVVSDSLQPPWTIAHQAFLQTRILEWIAIPFSRGSSQHRNRTLISCIAGRFFIIWATGKLFVAIISIILEKLAITERCFLCDMFT